MEVRETPPHDRTLLYLVTEDWYFVSHRLALASRAVRAGFRVVVACRVRDHGDAIRAVGCEVVPFTISRAGLNPLREAATIWRLRRLYQDLRPSLVHHVALKPVLYGSLAARVTGVSRVVNALAGLGYLSTSTTFKARVLRHLLELALRQVLGREGTWVIVQNPDDQRLLIEGGSVAQIARCSSVGWGWIFSGFIPGPSRPVHPSFCSQLECSGRRGSERLWRPPT